MLIIAGLVLLALGVAAVFYARHERAAERAAVATETVTCADLAALAAGVAGEVGAGGFTQRCEVVGEAELRDGGVVQAPESGVPAVWHRTKVTHRYWVMEERTQDGRKTRHREERSETVSEDASTAAFTVRDATGVVRVMPEHADIDRPEQVLDRFDRASDGGDSVVDGMFSALLRAGSDSGTIGFQHEEWAIRPGTRLYVHGEVSDRDGELSFGEPREKGRYLVSTRSEEELVAGSRRNARIAIGVAVLCVVVGLGLAIGGVATAASAVPAATLATTTDATVAGAADGWTAWSERTAAGFALVVRSPDGAVSRPAVRTRGVAFDLDLGRDARGRAVAAYSRCVTEPQAAGGANATAPAYATGKGCRLHVLDLATGAERRLARTAGTTSEFLPSIAGAKVAFAALKAGRTHRRVAFLQVRDLRTGRTVVLDRGPWRGGPVSLAGGPASIDTDGRHVAIVWRAQDTEFNSFDAVLRVAPVSGRRAAHQVSYGVNNDVCAYDSVLAPTVSGGTVTFAETDGRQWAAERVSVARPSGPRGRRSFGAAVFGETSAAVITSAALDGDRLVVAQTASSVGRRTGPTTVDVYAAGPFVSAAPPIEYCAG